MRKTPFSLKSLIPLRDRRKQEAANALRSATERRNELEGRVTHLKEEIETMEKRLLAAMTERFPVNDRLGRQSVLNMERSRLEALQLQLEDADLQREECRLEVIKARQEDRILQQLKKKHETVCKREREEEEERTAEDFVQAKWVEARD